MTKNWTMTTFTGLSFDPLAPDPALITLEDIAHALSLICRGGGHLRYHYSVGLHSLNCANEGRARGLDRRLQLACLLHDASEAYLSDIVSPVKHRLTEYPHFEHALEDAIFEHFGLGRLCEAEHAQVKSIDVSMLGNELHALLRGHEGCPRERLLSVPDLTEHAPSEVEQRFLERGRELLS